ncbi:MAG TPA: hypothetical protein VIK30_08010 [Polyangia bacterium]
MAASSSGDLRHEEVGREDVGMGALYADFVTTKGVVTVTVN